MGKDWLSFEIIALPLNSGSLPRLEGENARDILLLFPKDDDPASINFLERVMRAVGLDLHKDTCFASIEQGFEPSFVELSRAVAFEKLLLFGIQAEAIGLHLEHQQYQPIDFKGKTILEFDTPRFLADERAAGGTKKSSQLWAELKKIFNV